MTSLKETSPLKEFLEDNSAWYGSYQVKITYLGGQTKPTPTLIFHTFTRLVNRRHFQLFEQPSIPYVNDEFAVWQFAVDAITMQKFVESLAQNSNLASGSRALVEPYFSLLIVRGIGDRYCGDDELTGFESLINEIDAGDLIGVVTRTMNNHSHTLAQDVVDRWSRIVYPMALS